MSIYIGEGGNDEAAGRAGVGLVGGGGLACEACWR